MSEGREFAPDDLKRIEIQHAEAQEALRLEKLDNASTMKLYRCWHDRALQAEKQAGQAQVEREELRKQLAEAEMHLASEQRLHAMARRERDTAIARLQRVVDDHQAVQQEWAAVSVEKDKRLQQMERVVEAAVRHVAYIEKLTEAAIAAGARNAGPRSAAYEALRDALAGVEGQKP